MDPAHAELDPARASFLAWAALVQDAALDVRLAVGTAGYRMAVEALEAAQAGEVEAHQRLRDAARGHDLAAGVVARLDQDGAALEADLAGVRAHLAGLDDAAPSSR